LNLHLMRLIEEQHVRPTFYGWPRMTAHLHCQGYLTGTSVLLPKNSSRQHPKRGQEETDRWGMVHC
jgi:hypothetical protein